MAATYHVKPTGQWKEVVFDPSLLSNDRLEGFISFQELTDYEIKTTSKKEKKKLLTGNIDKTSSSKLDNRKKKKLKAKNKNKNTEFKDTSVSNEEDAYDKLSKSTEKVNKRKQAQHEVAPTRNRNSRKRKPETETPHPRKKQKKNKKNEDKNQTIVSGTDDIDNKSGSLRKPSTDMSAWKGLFVPDAVLCALEQQGFTSPTPIQALSLPSAIRDKMDIVGAAETGSGKTLAFGIPVIHHILNDLKTETDIEENVSDNGSETSDPEHSIKPSDVTEEDDEVGISEEDSRFDDDDIGERVSREEEYDLSPDEDGDIEEDEPTKTLLALVLTPTRELAIQVKNHLATAAKYTDIKIVTVVGGMSQEKQERLLRKQPEIVVATPGRLWELIQQGNPHLSTMPHLKYLVVDEADRIIEKGHFLETKKLLSMLNTSERAKAKRQTFVFSATLSLVHAGPQRVIKKKHSVKLNTKQKLELLVNDLGIKPKHKVVDLTKKTGVVETLLETRINCTNEEKDVYLYYFLVYHPGRTLVFANSKDCIRRLTSLLGLLQCNPLPLHAEMHQKQRLKNLDKFSANDHGLLLATDVAARGLDIPNVQHVIHYQVPRTSEGYVHRSGRTARASKEGVSVLLIGQDDMKNYRKIAKTLGKLEDVPAFPVDNQYIHIVKSRVALAREVDVLDHRFKKQKRSNDWFLKAAEEMDIELDDNMLNDMGDSAEQLKHSKKVGHLKDELDAMLKEPLLPRSFSGKYVTRTGKLIDPTALRKSSKDAVSTVKRQQTLPIESDMKAPKAKKKKKFYKTKA